MRCDTKTWGSKGPPTLKSGGYSHRNSERFASVPTACITRWCAIPAVDKPLCAVVLRFLTLQVRVHPFSWSSGCVPSWRIPRRRSHSASTVTTPTRAGGRILACELMCCIASGCTSVYSTWGAYEINENPSKERSTDTYCSISYDASLLNGLQAMPQWQKYFNNPDSSRLGLISASLFLRKMHPVLTSRESVLIY